MSVRFIFKLPNFLSLSCQDARNLEFSSGPSNGTLIIIGGGDISESIEGDRYNLRERKILN